MKQTSRRVFFSAKSAARAFNEAFTTQVAAASKKYISNFVSPQNTHHLRHGGGWHNPANPNADPGEILTHRAESTVRTQDLIEHRIEILDEAIQTVAAEMQRQFLVNITKLIEDTTNQTGNVVDGAGRPFSESYLRMLELSHWSVSAQGEVQPPQFINGTDIQSKALAMAQSDPEFAARIASIIEGKIAEAQREESERKARFSCYGGT